MANSVLAGTRSYYGVARDLNCCVGCFACCVVVVVALLAQEKKKQEIRDESQAQPR